MRQFYRLINDRAEQHIPTDRTFKEAFPDYVDWMVIWYREAEHLCEEFRAEGLLETAQAIRALIQENLASSWHDKDRHIILGKLEHDYNFVVDTA